MTYLGSAVFLKWSQIGPKLRALFVDTSSSEGSSNISTSGSDWDPDAPDSAVADDADDVDAVVAAEGIAPPSEFGSSSIFALFTSNSDFKLKLKKKNNLAATW